GREDRWPDNTGNPSNGRDNESDLTAGYHANTNAKRVHGTHSRDHRSDSGPDKFGDNGDGYKSRRQDWSCAEVTAAEGQADTDEENGHEERLSQGSYGVHRVLMRAGLCNSHTREIGAGDCRDATKRLGCPARE